jgi:cysteinyl-tRNA synthetase
MTDQTPLKLFNSLTRQLENFVPIHGNEARVYTCGPTVYNYQHIGNMRAYVFADTLGRALRFKGYDVKHVINITDVGHLTSDADAGDDKMEKAASAAGKSAWDIAAFYQADFEADLARLNIQGMQHPKATDYVAAMIEWATSIEEKHCYVLDGGLYFDVSTVPDYGSLARTTTDDGQSRIDPVPGKRNPQDFAIWRRTPEGETRQMEWDSPWGRGAPGWHLECSVMSQALLGFPFDIHTGGIDHREVHHPCEIAQNQALFPEMPDGAGTGARIWMHNNFLIDRRGKMSKSSGEFLRLQTLVDRGFHPLAYRLMCLQAHYRSEMEFTWEGLAAATVRLKRIYLAAENLRQQNQLLTHEVPDFIKKYEGNSRFTPYFEKFVDMTFDALPEDRPTPGDHYHHYEMNLMHSALGHDLKTPELITYMETMIGYREPVLDANAMVKIYLVAKFDSILGLGILTTSRAELRIRPASATLTEADIEARLNMRLLRKVLR